MPTLILLNSQVYQAPECDDEPEGTLFSWFGPILFLPHQNNVMDHSWLLAMKQKTKSRVYMCIKTLAQNFPGLLIPH